MRREDKIIRKLKNTFTILVIMLICFSAGEIALRVYNHFHPLFIFYDESYNRFRGQPNSKYYNFKLNSGGFLDTEFSKKNKNIYRIIGIGDSFAFGSVPYQYNYLTILETMFQQTGLKVEVLNMGIPCIGPKQYLSLFVNEGIALKPDMLLLSFFMGNDLTDTFFDVNEQKYIYNYFYLLALYRYIFIIHPKYIGRNYSEFSEYDDNMPEFKHSEYLEIEQFRSPICTWKTREFNKFFNGTTYYLFEIKKICDKENIKLVIIVIPDELQINQKLQKEVKEIIDPNLIWNNSLSNDKLTKWFDSVGIDYIDLYKVFVTEGAHQRLYKPDESHWNIAGNKLAAQIICNYLSKKMTECNYRLTVKK